MLYELASPLPSPVAAHIVGDWVELRHPDAEPHTKPLRTISRETFEARYLPARS